MTAQTLADKEIFRQVVRGERPWTDLRALGIEIELNGDQCLYRNPQNIELTADIFDIANGFLNLLQDAEQLRQWAFMLEAADIELDLESHPGGETLLDALWRASFGDPLSEETVKIIEQLAHESSNHK